MELDKKTLISAALVLLLSFGIWQYPTRVTLPEFSEAAQVQSALAGRAALLHSQLAAALLPASAALSGTQAGSPGAIVSFLLIFSPLLLAASALFIFLSMRQLGAGNAAAAFAALLLTLSQPAMQFLPGSYGSLQVSALFFSLSLFHLSSYAGKGKGLMLVPAAVFAAVSAYLSPAFGAAGVLFAVSFAAPKFSQDKKQALAFAGIAGAFAVAAILSPLFPQLSASAANAQSLFAVAPFLLAASSCAAALFLSGQLPLQYALLFALSPLAAAFQPLAAALLLAFPAGAAASRLREGVKPRRALAACALLACFFASFGLLLPLAGAYQSAAVSAMVGAGAVLLLHLYDYRGREAFTLAFALLFSLSLFSALFQPLSPAYPAYADEGISASLSYLASKGASSVSLLGSADAARFYLPSAALGPEESLSGYLLDGSRPQPGYAILSLSYLDYPEKLYGKSAPAFTAFSYRTQFSGNGADFALFSSADGLLLARQLDSGGKFALKDAVLLDAAGQAYGSWPLSRIFLLRPDLPFSDRENRLIALEEGSLPPHFLSVYAGTAGAARPVFEHGSAVVYEVD